MGVLSVRAMSLCQLLSAASLYGVLIVAPACDSAPAPMAPIASASGSTDKKTSGSGEKDGSTSSDDGEKFASASGEQASSGSGSASTSGSEPSKFQRDGAQSVGDDAQKQEVKACAAKGNFFDRFGDPKATCTQIALAKLDCTKAGIEAAIASSANLKSQFAKSITGDYAGMEIDQCIDCPKDSDIELCKTGTPSAPPTRGGTKVLFVKLEGQRIDGKRMFIPIRPFQQ